MRMCAKIRLIGKKGGCSAWRRGGVQAEVPRSRSSVLVRHGLHHHQLRAGLSRNGAGAQRVCVPDVNFALMSGGGGGRVSCSRSRGRSRSSDDRARKDTCLSRATAAAAASAALAPTDPSGCRGQRGQVAHRACHAHGRVGLDQIGGACSRGGRGRRGGRGAGGHARTGGRGGESTAMGGQQGRQHRHAARAQVHATAAAAAPIGRRQGRG